MSAPPDLRTRYLGLELRSPIVASASPLNDQLERVQEIEDAGAAAIVMPSLFEEEILFEEIELNRSLEAGSGHFAEALDYFPAVGELASTADRYLARLEAIKAQCSVPVIASLNATSTGAWTRYAQLMADAGADAVELNLYHVVADPSRRAADIEASDVEIIESVRSALDVPLAVKLSPYYSAMANFAQQAVDAGADGLVLFNRFYQPDLDLDTL
ncbi:MAG TPA: dihydroorotate dehydrogenase-like protein, partial [Acidimicrobiia bacterium]